MGIGFVIASSIISALTALGIDGLSKKENASGNTDILKNNQTICSIPDVKDIRLDPFDFFEWIPSRVSTSLTERPNTPTIEIKNPYKKDIRITNLSFVPDANFKLYGSLEVMVNEVPKLRGKSASTFLDVGVINVPLPEGGIVLKRNKSVEIRIWTSVGTVFLTTSVAMGDFL